MSARRHAEPLRSVLEAPAKVNLGLRVTGVRPDGRHELESVFVPLELADRIRLEVSSGSGVALEVGGALPDVPAGADNLAVKAATAFLARAGVDRRVEIALEKHIPSPAGLGGGSSDAGAVLRGLAAALPGAVSPESLAGIALELGADVPFFLEPRPALVTGTGERIAPLVDLPAGRVASWRTRAPIRASRIRAGSSRPGARRGPVAIRA